MSVKMTFPRLQNNQPPLYIYIKNSIETKTAEKNQGSFKCNHHGSLKTSAIGEVLFVNPNCKSKLQQEMECMTVI